MKPKAKQETIPSIDPDVQELCDNFHIEDRHCHRLNELMKTRRDTFEADMLKLWEKLEDAREPAGLLVVKMKEMEQGTFIGKQKADATLQAMIKRYGLDGTAETRLADILGRYDEAKKKVMYEELDRHLEVSNKPSAMAMLLLRKLSDGTPLGRPGPIAPGSYLDRKMKEERDKRDESRERERASPVRERERGDDPFAERGDRGGRERDRGRDDRQDRDQRDRGHERERRDFDRDRRGGGGGDYRGDRGGDHGGHRGRQGRRSRSRQRG